MTKDEEEKFLKKNPELKYISDFEERLGLFDVLDVLNAIYSIIGFDTQSEDDQFRTEEFYDEKLDSNIEAEWESSGKNELETKFSEIPLSTHTQKPQWINEDPQSVSSKEKRRFFLVEECPICRKSIENEHDLAICPGCGSHFHESHFALVIKMIGKCPVCQKKIKMAS